jgi:hypothetical protein
MLSIIYILIFTVICRQLVTVLNFSQSLITIPTQIVYVICGFLIVNKFYKFSISHQRRRIHHINMNNLDFQPLTITIEQHVIRIPLEDQVDLEIDDMHNVHNKTIKRGAIMAINELKKTDEGKYSVKSAISDIREHLESQPDGIPEKTIGIAFQSLRLIYEMDSTYQTSGIKELEILRLVWERINHKNNLGVVDQLKENVVKELADCYRGNGSVHCCEGRITRILQSLQNCDAENVVDLRPMWAYKDEIVNKITKYRDKLSKKLPTKYAGLDEKLVMSDTDKKMVSQINRCLIKNLEKRFEKDYIELGYLNRIELDDITRVYYESLYDF